MQQKREMRAEFADVMRRHADTVLRVCYLYLHQKADAEDAFQDTFVRYAKAVSSGTAFADDEHRKAWLIRVAANVCKDMLKSPASKVELVGEVDDELVSSSAEGRASDEMSDETPGETLGARDGPDAVGKALRALDERYRVPIYLHYYEGKTAAEIGEMLGVPTNTVYTNMARGRAKLKEVLTDGCTR